MSGIVPVTSIALNENAGPCHQEMFKMLQYQQFMVDDLMLQV